VNETKSYPVLIKEDHMKRSHKDLPVYPHVKRPQMEYKEEPLVSWGAGLLLAVICFVVYLLIKS
jgi:hypothetical protein